MLTHDISSILSQLAQSSQCVDSKLSLLYKWGWGLVWWLGNCILLFPQKPLLNDNMFCGMTLHFCNIELWVDECVWGAALFALCWNCLLRLIAAITRSTVPPSITQLSQRTTHPELVWQLRMLSRPMRDRYSLDIFKDVHAVYFSLFLSIYA